MEELKIAVRRIKTIIINPKMTFPDFEVVTGMNRAYVKQILCDEHVKKIDSCNIRDFYEKKCDEDIYKKECLKFDSKMRDCYAYMRDKIDNYRVFSRFDSDRVVREDPGIVEVVPVMAYFGQFMFEEAVIGKYGLTQIEKMVVCQILTATEKMRNTYQLAKEEIEIVKSRFQLHVPALFVRSFKSDLPAMYIDDIIEKIMVVDSLEAQQQNKVEKKRLEDIMNISTMEMMDVVVIATEKEESMTFVFEAVGITEPFYLVSAIEYEKELVVPLANLSEEYEMIGITFREDYDNIFFERRGYEVKKNRYELFQLVFAASSERLPREIVKEMFYYENPICLIVLSRVSKNWYMAMKQMGMWNDTARRKFPRSRVKEKTVRIVELLQSMSMEVIDSPISHFVMAAMDSYVLDSSDFVAFIKRYAKVVIPGVILILSILYMKMSDSKHRYDVVLDYLIKFYDGLSAYVKRVIDEKLNFASQVQRFDYYTRRRYRKEVRFRGYRLMPVGCCANVVWDGLEFQHLSKENVSIGLFNHYVYEYLSLSKMPKIECDKK
jgi:hypothetical protein